MAQRVGIRRGLVVSSTPPPHFTPGKDPVPVLQEAGWAPGPVWTGGKSRPHRDSPARSQSLHRLSYPAHANVKVQNIFHGRNNITRSTDCQYRTAATLYTLETWSVSGEKLIINALHKGDTQYTKKCYIKKTRVFSR